MTRRNQGEEGEKGEEEGKVQGSKREKRRGREGTSRTVCPGWPHQGKDKGRRNEGQGENIMKYEDTYIKTERSRIEGRAIGGGAMLRAGQYAQANK